VRRNKKVQPSTAKMQAIDLIELGRAKFGTYDKLCQAADVPKSTIWRLRTGRSKKLWPQTIEKLTKAIYRQEDQL
jgi:hypothetical protein